MNYDQHLIGESATVLEALQRLNELGTDLNLFVVDEAGRLHGSITDGDIRRGLVRGARLESPAVDVMHTAYSALYQGAIDLHYVQEKRRHGLKMLPIVDKQQRVVDLLNFKHHRTRLPLEAVIMAGGRGTRLAPLTHDTPKPLLPVGEKPIIAYILEQLQKYGLSRIVITVNYLREQIEYYVAQLPPSDTTVSCVSEDQPLGTIGALSRIRHWEQDYVLLTNSDLLTTIDYEDFFLNFITSGADMMVATAAYPVKIPYAVLQTNQNQVTAFREKPEHTYHVSTGIYLLRRELISLIPTNSFYNATDLMDRLISEEYKLAYYPMVAYWLDIGKPDDYRKAQEDIKHLTF